MTRIAIRSHSHEHAGVLAAAGVEVVLAARRADKLASEVERLRGILEKLEFRRMFSGEMDPNNCYLDIQAGSGGTEAQDWASMLLRMYLRWAEAKGFKTEVIEESDGDVAGAIAAAREGQGALADCLQALGRAAELDGGAALAAERHPDLELLLYGDREQVAPLVAAERAECAVDWAAVEALIAAKV